MGPSNVKIITSSDTIFLVHVVPVESGKGALVKQHFNDNTDSIDLWEKDVECQREYPIPGKTDYEAGCIVPHRMYIIEKREPSIGDMTFFRKKLHYVGEEESEDQSFLERCIGTIVASDDPDIDVKRIPRKFLRKYAKNPKIFQVKLVHQYDLNVPKIKTNHKNQVMPLTNISHSVENLPMLLEKFLKDSSKWNPLTGEESRKNINNWIENNL